MKAAWERFGRTPRDLFGSLTPSQFVLLCCRPAGRQGDAPADRVEALRLANDERGRRGERPAVPSWL